jgi:hypothetical protein
MRLFSRVVLSSAIAVALLALRTLQILSHPNLYGNLYEYLQMPALDKEYAKNFSVTPLRALDMEQYTIRINTWKRHDQLLASVKHHSSCPGVAQIRVLWSEPGEPPPELLQNPKVVWEKHLVNSMNERFACKREPPTYGILSIDDDVVRPCEAIDSGMLFLEKMAGAVF